MEKTKLSLTELQWLKMLGIGESAVTSNQIPKATRIKIEDWNGCHQTQKCSSRTIKRVVESQENLWHHGAGKKERHLKTWTGHWMDTEGMKRRQWSKRAEPWRKEDELLPWQYSNKNNPEPEPRKEVEKMPLRSPSLVHRKIKWERKEVRLDLQNSVSKALTIK